MQEYRINKQVIAISTIIIILLALIPFSVFGNQESQTSVLAGEVSADALKTSQTGNFSSDQLLAQSKNETDASVKVKTNTQSKLKLGDKLSLTLTFGSQNTKQTLVKGSVLGFKVPSTGVDYANLKQDLPAEYYTVTPKPDQNLIVITLKRSITVSGDTYELSAPVQKGNLSIPLYFGIYWATGNQVDSQQVGTLNLENYVESAASAVTSQNNSNSAAQESVISTGESVPEVTPPIQQPDHFIQKNSLERATNYTFSVVDLTSGALIAGSTSNLKSSFGGGIEQLVSGLTPVPITSFGMDGNYQLKEQTAAPGYNLNSNIYYIKYTTSGTVSGVSQDGITFSSITKDGMLSVSGSKIVLKSMRANTISVVDKKDSKPLMGSKYTVWNAFGAAIYSGTIDKAQVPITGIDESGTYHWKQDQPTPNYARNVKTYYFKFTKGIGIMSVSDDGITYGTTTKDGLARVNNKQLVVIEQALEVFKVVDKESGQPVIGGQYTFIDGFGAIIYSGTTTSPETGITGISNSNSIYHFSETKPARYYEANRTLYYFKFVLGQGITGVSITGYENDFSSTTKDGMVSVVGGKIVIKSLKMYGFSVVDQQTNAVVTGGTYRVLNSGGSQIYSGQVVSDFTGIAAIKPSGTYQIQETKGAPNYVRNATNYYFKVVTGTGITGVGTDGNSFSTATADGQASIVDNQLIFKSRKQPTIIVKDKDTGVVIAGGTFDVYDGHQNNTITAQAVPISIGLSQAQNVLNAYLAEIAQPQGYWHNENKYYFNYSLTAGITGIFVNQAGTGTNSGSSDGLVTLENGNLTFYTKKATYLTLDRDVLVVKQNELGTDKAKAEGTWYDLFAPPQLVDMQVQVDGGAMGTFKTGLAATGSNDEFGTGRFELTFLDDQSVANDGKVGLKRADGTILGEHEVSFLANGTILSNPKKMKVIVLPNDYPFKFKLTKYILQNNQKVTLASIHGPGSDYPQGEKVRVGTDVLNESTATGPGLNGATITTTIPKQLTYKGNMTVTDESGATITGIVVTGPDANGKLAIKLPYTFKAGQAVHIAYDLQANSVMPASDDDNTGGAILQDTLTGTSTDPNILYYSDLSNIARLIAANSRDLLLTNVPDLHFGQHMNTPTEADGSGVYSSREGVSNPENDYYEVEDRRVSLGTWSVTAELSEFQAKDVESGEDLPNLPHLRDAALTFYPAENDHTLTPFSVVSGADSQVILTSEQSVNGNISHQRVWKLPLDKIELKVPDVANNSGTAKYHATMTYNVINGIF